MTERNRIPAKKYSAIVAFFVVTVVSVAFVASQHVAVAWNQATGRHIQPYTSLSYINIGRLPTYAPAGSTQHITFRITNQEASVIPYSYQVLLSTNSQAKVLHEGTVTLRDGSSVDRTISFTLPQPNMDATIIVRLVDRAEYITFGTKS